MRTDQFDDDNLECAQLALRRKLILSVSDTILTNYDYTRHSKALVRKDMMMFIWCQLCRKSTSPIISSISVTFGGNLCPLSERKQTISGIPFVSVIFNVSVSIMISYCDKQIDTVFNLLHTNFSSFLKFQTAEAEFWGPTCRKSASPSVRFCIFKGWISKLWCSCIFRKFPSSQHIWWTCST